MQFRQLLTDDDAVSPVIGVILMVAITVILAAVIASFVLGIGDNQQVQPTAQFDFDYDSGDNNVSVTHTSGDSVANSSVVIRGSGIVSGNNSAVDDRFWNYGASVPMTGDGNESFNGRLSGNIDGQDAIVSGDSVSIPVNGDDWDIRVVWESSGGGSTATLAQESGPGA